MTEVLNEESLKSALSEYAAARSDNSETATQDHLTELAGGDETLQIVYETVAEFLQENPKIFSRGVFGSPDLTALYTGILIGRSLSAEPSLAATE